MLTKGKQAAAKWPVVDVPVATATAAATTTTTAAAAMQFCILLRKVTVKSFSQPKTTATATTTTTRRTQSDSERLSGQANVLFLLCEGFTHKGSDSQKAKPKVAKRIKKVNSQVN